MKYLIFIFSLVTVFSVKAQTIKFSLDHPDTSVYMAKYFGSKLYYADTSDLVNGQFTYDGSKHEAGLYAIILPNGKPFDFILDDEKEVEMTIADINDPIESMAVKKSINNTVFFDYMRFMSKMRLDGQKLSANVKNPETSEKDKEKAKEELSKINDKVTSYQENVIKTNESKFVALMIQMTIDPKLPDHPRDENGVITDSNAVYHYYIDHFWDNVDLTDPRAVNTPVFHNKLDKYFSPKGILQIPDTICQYATKLIGKTNEADQSNRVFQYIVHHVTNKYETSQIMGMDKVFHYMAKNYYCAPNNRAFWMTEENTTKVCERATKIGRTLVGNPSIRIRLPDSTETNWIDSYAIKADYTILYFWDPNCGHCKKVTPKLQTLYEKKFKERNVEIFAVAKATYDDFAKWKNFIRENKLSFINVGLTKQVYEDAQNQEKLAVLLTKHTTIQSLNYSDTYDIYSTPRIFVLDKDKNILYKQLSIGQLEEIIDRLTGHAADEKLFPLSDPENGENPGTH